MLYLPATVYNLKLSLVGSLKEKHQFLSEKVVLLTVFYSRIIKFYDDHTVNY